MPQLARSFFGWRMSAPAEAVARLMGRDIAAVRPLSGGDLSSVFHVTLGNGEVLVAKQVATALGEADMLRTVAATGAPAPMVLACEGSWLLLEFIRHVEGMGSAWADLGDVLLRLHAKRAERYGWSVDHAFGSVAIENGWAEAWPAFWADRRLRCHLPFLRTDLARRVEHVADRIDALLPRYPPAALLHGDLWGGNILMAGARVAALIDPACYYGDREADVAMLTLFDRPPTTFFDALALAPGWRERIAVYHLWPLIVHLRLFGDSYAERLARLLSSLGF